MSNKKSKILSDKKIEQKTRRIAYEIIENNFQEEVIYIIGIRENGFRFAQNLSKIVRDIGEVQVETGGVKLNKKKPVDNKIDLDIEGEELNDKVVILVDDVTNTGRTLMYALTPFMEITPKKLLTAVLVDRKHKSFPVSPDYVGLSLATTMQEHITVELEGTPTAYLV